MKLSGLTDAELDARAEEVMLAEHAAQGVSLGADPVRVARTAEVLDNDPGVLAARRLRKAS